MLAKLSKIQRNYLATKRELFGINYFTQQFKNHLLGQHFLNITHHRALVWIYKFKEPDGMVARRTENLGQFNIDIKYMEGKKIPRADSLSGINTEDDEQTFFVNASG